MSSSYNVLRFAHHNVNRHSRAGSREPRMFMSFNRKVAYGRHAAVATGAAGSSRGALSPTSPRGHGLVRNSLLVAYPEQFLDSVVAMSSLHSAGVQSTVKTPRTTWLHDVLRWRSWILDVVVFFITASHVVFAAGKGGIGPGGARHSSAVDQDTSSCRAVKWQANCYINTAVSYKWSYS